mmetsp:Transcript_20188/g.62389  ORF Transcript_20188/g.62389 Transcript_20188/m.62389 type:complete len:318 (+) Transcript_20188:69-1022(+)
MPCTEGLPSWVERTTLGTQASADVQTPPIAAYVACSSRCMSSKRCSCCWQRPARARWLFSSLRRPSASRKRALRSLSLSRHRPSATRIASSSSAICALAAACSRTRASRSRCTRSRSRRAAQARARHSASSRCVRRATAAMRSRAARQVCSSRARMAASCASAPRRSRASCAAATLLAICARSSWRQSSARSGRSMRSGSTACATGAAPFAALTELPTVLASALHATTSTAMPSVPSASAPFGSTAALPGSSGFTSGGGASAATRRDKSALAAAAISRLRTSVCNFSFLLHSCCTKSSCTSRLYFNLSMNPAGRLFR